MRTIIDVTLKMTKEEMFIVFEDFIQHGKCKVKAEGGPMINFVKEGNGADLRDAEDTVVEKLTKKGILLDTTRATIEAAERGGRIDRKEEEGKKPLVNVVEYAIGVVEKGGSML